MARIGFMQGRLSPMVDGRIQAFPWAHWEQEFESAGTLGLPLIEWTLDQDRLHDNPLMTDAGRARIRELSARSGVRVESVTGDCFMQAPFFKAQGDTRRALLRDLAAVIDATAALGARCIVFPLVDGASIENAGQESALVEGLATLGPRLRERDVRVVFESDFPPQRLREFIARFPRDHFGINYDIGNSAALGFDAEDEIATYGPWIYHVHVKDRVLGGTTVPLGEGNAKFESVFAALRRAQYRGDFILQTARAADGRHAEALARYRDAVNGWWGANGPQA